MMEEASPLAELERALGYRFQELALLEDALTHASAIGPAGLRSAERLEFLGDSVVGLVLSDLLTCHYREEDEGKLSKYRAALVNTSSLANKARELRLDRHLRLGRGEEKSRGREKNRILAATYEAVIGAVFRDGGYVMARRLLEHHFGEAVAGVCRLESTDPKTELQEVCQATCRRAPSYRLEREEGPDHARRFRVEVLLGDVSLASGEGSSKRTAEQAAALNALRESRDLILSLAESDD